MNIEQIHHNARLDLEIIEADLENKNREMKNDIIIKRWEKECAENPDKFIPCVGLDYSVRKYVYGYRYV